MEILNDLLKITPLSSTLIGSYFWIRRNVWSSYISIAKMAKSRLENNESLIGELSAQRADSLIAWVYIALSTLSQTILNFIPMPTTWDYSTTFQFKHLIYFLVSCFFLYLVGDIVSRWMEERTIKKTMKYLREKGEI